jgi:sulfur carrier protein
MQLIINGEPREVEDGLTVAGLLAQLGPPLSGQVAVEVNAEVVRRARHTEHQLCPGDRVEVVTFVGGG